MDAVTEHVTECARRARAAAPGVAAADDARLDAALEAIAAGLAGTADELPAGGGEEVAAGGGTLSHGVIDRLRLDEARLGGMVDQVRALAALPPAPRAG